MKRGAKMHADRFTCCLVILQLMQLDRSKSLEDHKFHPQEALIIEEEHEDEA